MNTTSNQNQTKATANALTSADVNFIHVPGHGVTVIVRNKQYVVASSHENYVELVEALNVEDYSNLENLLDTETRVSKYVSTSADIEVKNGGVYFQGQALDGVIIDRILGYMKNGLAYDRLVKFLGKLLKNPSMHSVTQLYSFMERNNLTIAEDGDFLAYKSVRPNYQSITAGKDGKTLDNSVGNTVKMPRNQIDDNPDTHCSQGLHCGDLRYVSGFGGDTKRVVIVKVSPENVVSVPNDYDCQKMRVSEYTVIADFQGELPQYAADTDSLYDGDEDESGAYVDEDEDYSY